MLHSDGDTGVSIKGQPPGQHLEQHNTDGVNIRGRPNVFSHRLLWGNVMGRSPYRSLFRKALGRAERDSDPKVRDFHVVAGGEQHVLGLDITVNQTSTMSDTHCLADLCGDIHRTVDAQGRRLEHNIFQVDSFDVLHDDITLVAILAHVIHGDDVGVGETGRGLCLLKEPDQKGRFAGILRSKQFDGNGAPQQHVLSTIDLSHATFAHFN